MRIITVFAVVTLAMQLPALASVSLAHDEPAMARFDSGAVAFDVPSSLLVTTTTVDSPEGPVDVITVFPHDPVNGSRIGATFMSFSVYHAIPVLPDVEGVASADDVRDMVLSSIATTLGQRRVGHAEELEFDLGTQRIDGLRLTWRIRGASAEVSAGAIRDGDRTLVFYYQRVTADAAWFDDFHTLTRTLAFGGGS